MSSEKRTPLYDQHVSAGARIVPFAGYLMPLEYTGILGEHRAVRQRMGMFDLSHMGEFLVRGSGALEAVDRVVTNEVRNLEIWQARYSPMCTEEGGIVDDLLVYRYPDRVMLVVNASNIAKDFAWISKHIGSDALLTDVSDEVALIAVQGPQSVEFTQSLTTLDIEAIGYYHFSDGEVAGVPATISRTGYTGEDGIELYVHSNRAAELWRALWEMGEERGLALAGLGARDTLRLEAGLALYGNDITEQTSPFDAGLGWTVKLGSRCFVGCDALQAQKERGLDRRLVVFDMLDRSIPRPHYPVLIDGQPAGEVTSGTFSPTFEKGIGMAYLPLSQAKVGQQVEIDVRGHTHPAQIAKKPMYKRLD